MALWGKAIGSRRILQHRGRDGITDHYFFVPSAEDGLYEATLHFSVPDELRRSSTNPGPQAFVIVIRYSPGVDAANLRVDTYLADITEPLALYSRLALSFSDFLPMYQGLRYRPDEVLEDSTPWSSASMRANAVAGVHQKSSWAPGSAETGWRVPERPGQSSAGAAEAAPMAAVLVEWLVRNGWLVDQGGGTYRLAPGVSVKP